MSTTLLPIFETITSSWDKVKGSKSTFWAGFGLMFVIMFLLGFVSGLFSHIHVISMGLKIIAQVLNFLLQMGLLYIGIQRAFDLPISYHMMFNSLELNRAIKIISLYILEIVILIPVFILGFIGYIITNTALSFIVSAVSLILGVYLAMRMFMAMAFVLDKQVHPWAAIKLSFQATKDNVLNLIGIILIEFLILFISALPLGIGLIWALPLCFIAYGMVYKKLLPNVSVK